MKDFIDGFIKGAKETPLGFFAPAIAVWRLLLTTTDDLCAASQINSESES